METKRKRKCQEATVVKIEPTEDPLQPEILLEEQSFHVKQEPTENPLQPEILFEEENFHVKQEPTEDSLKPEISFEEENIYIKEEPRECDKDAKQEVNADSEELQEDETLSSSEENMPKRRLRVRPKKQNHAKGVKQEVNADSEELQEDETSSSSADSIPKLRKRGRPKKQNYAKRVQQVINADSEELQKDETSSSRKDSIPKRRKRGRPKKQNCIKGVKQYGVRPLLNPSKFQIMTDSEGKAKSLPALDLWPCDSCPVVLSLEELRKHKMSEHTTTTVKMSEHTTTTVCMECGECFSNKAAFANHLIEHLNERPYTCDLCSVDFPTLTELTNHKSTHFDTAQQDGNLWVHTVDILNGEDAAEGGLSQSVQVTIDNYIDTSDKGMLESANQVQGTDIDTSSKTEKGQSFDCIVCERKFKLTSAFRRHMRVHEKRNQLPILSGNLIDS